MNECQFITFEGLSTTFKASMNVYFAYFCHICSLLVIILLSSNTKAVRHTCNCIVQSLEI